MPSRNKQRGYEAEVALLKVAQGNGFEGRRAWGSDGRAMGMNAKVDAEIEGLTYQCKRKKLAPAYLSDMMDLIKKGVVDAASFYFDRKGTWIFLPAADYFALRARAEGKRASADLRSVEGEDE